MSKQKEILCNLCGLSCTLYETTDEGYATSGVYDHCGLINAEVEGGYFSTPGTSPPDGHGGTLDDGSVYKFSICEFCLDWLFSQFKIPVTIQYFNPNVDQEIFETWKPAIQRVTEDNWREFKEEFFKEFQERNEARGNGTAIVTGQKTTSVSEHLTVTEFEMTAEAKECIQIEASKRSDLGIK